MPRAARPVKRRSKEVKRPFPDTEWEARLGYPSRRVAGVDEVGRGCLAGPVVAGAVILPSTFDRADPRLAWLADVHDSKLVSAEVRERLTPLIEEWAAAFAIGVATVEEIDRINIHHASHLAMERAIRALGLKPDRALVDGKFVPKGLGCPTTAVVKGDQLCLSIACASIIAKVWRDRHLKELDTLYPGYGFAGHKGYFTPEHQEALKRLGPCLIHRRSFAPVGASLSLKRESQGELLF